MSLYDYRISEQFVTQDPPFAALIMAAARKADSTNFGRLTDAFPEIIAELRDRYDAPGGYLEGEARS